MFRMLKTLASFIGIVIVVLIAWKYFGGDPATVIGSVTDLLVNIIGIGVDAGTQAFTKIRTLV